MAFFGGTLGLMAVVCGGALAALHPQHDEPPAGAKVKIEVRDGYRYISSNGLPDHDTGSFPGRGNPNSIKAQDYLFRVTMTPKATEKATVIQTDRGGPPTLAGVALNGVVFDPGTAEFWKNDRNSGWHITAIGPGPDLGIDKNHAHVQPNGAYHYHAVPTGLVERLKGKDAGMVQVGWAADGFPIYARWGYEKATDSKSAVRAMKSSYRLKAGERPKDGPQGKYDGTYEQDYEFVAGLGDLDECNGRTGVTPEFPGGTYYYVATDEYPNLLRSLKGTPDETFKKKPPGRGEGRGRPGGPPPPPRERRSAEPK